MSDNKDQKTEDPKSQEKSENLSSAGASEPKSTDEKLKEVEDKLLRSLAEIENQRRRFEKEIKDAFEFGSYNFAKESLAILDNLHRAQIAIRNDDGLKDNKDLDKFLNNISIIEKDIISIFEKNKIKKINTKNHKFDPNLHQAMTEIEDDNVETGSIIQEIQAGFMMGERLLRPALVAVSRKKAQKRPEKEDKKDSK